MKGPIHTSAALLVLWIGSAVFAQEQPDIPPADEWYRSVYAPVYLDKPWDKAAEVASHFTETIHDHDDGGGQFNGYEWIFSAMEDWKIDGWIRSELAELDYDQLNPTTATFKAKWRDYYTGGNIAYECGWYLADFAEGRWLISEYATINCADHGL